MTALRSGGTEPLRLAVLQQGEAGWRAAQGYMQARRDGALPPGSSRQALATPLPPAQPPSSQPAAAASAT
jgi:hypothetical protein